MASQTYKGWSVVTASTLAFTVCFMVWMMFAVIGVPVSKTLGLRETQFGLLLAMPVLTGSLIRVPLGMWADKFGGRIVFFVLMLSTVIPIFMISRATEFWQFLATSLFVGVAGGSFTVGIAYCARWSRRFMQSLCWSPQSCSGYSPIPTRPTTWARRSPCASSLRRSKTPRCGGTASTIPSYSAATWPWPCG